MRRLLCLVTLSGPLLLGALSAQEVVGKRPYELDWAKRTQDDHPALVDFEDLAGWRVDVKDAVATFVRTREQQIWGLSVGKLTYRATGAQPEVTVRPPQPLAIPAAWDAVTCWVYGNNWAYAANPSTPPVHISLLFQGATGPETAVSLITVTWEEWFLCHRRLTPEQIVSLGAAGTRFTGIRIANGRNKEDRAIFFDSLAVFAESFPPLTFAPRSERGIPMFPGEGIGTNTGPGKLPFPNRLETILPDNQTKDFKTAVVEPGNGYLFTYEGTDGKLAYRLDPKTGAFADLSVSWAAAGGTIRPGVGGGVYLASPKGPVPPEKSEPIETRRVADTVVSRWRLTAGAATVDATFTYRLWGKSLVIDVAAPGGQVAEVRYGRAQGLDRPRVVTLPYYTYGEGGRPGIVVSGPAEQPLFLAGHTDWYLSNASAPWAGTGVDAQGAAYNGGTRYTPKTDGKRNDCYERFFLVVSPRVEEVLPNIPNPVSPWKRITGTRVWRAHGAGVRENDAKYWRRVQRHGMTEVVVTDHETGWRDGGESFTFRTRPAPGKGGDEGQFGYARIMQDELGFTYGPYNNYTDFAPVNEFWSADLINRTPDNQLQQAWMRCYAPKATRAVEYCARLAPIIQEKFRFSTAYCDVHTAVTPWSRTDYDARVPGAGTFAAVYYAYGEIMLLQKEAWNGPVYSEGNNHWLYCGLTDGNYAQDQNYRIPDNPWLVDFDLRKMHDLCCNFGMGAPSMFYGRDAHPGGKPGDADAFMDCFLAATVAFGHPGFLAFDGGFRNALRSYYLLQQLHSRYTQTQAGDIRYVAADGRLLDTSAALASGAYQRSQLVTHYADGTVTVVNGHRSERLTVTVDGRPLDLPPNGYAGWTADGAIDVFSGDRAGRRCDLAVSPAYLYVDGRGHWARFPTAASRGIGICRFLPDGKHEIIPFENGECGFAISATGASALDEARNVIGAAELRRARGLTYVLPVKGAFSYVLEGGTPAAAAALTCDRDTVVPGERVTVRGREGHTFQVPPDAKPGARLWQQFEDAWIDFTVVPLADVTLSLDGNRLDIAVASRLGRAAAATLKVRDRVSNLQLVPGTPATVTLDLGAPPAETVEPLRLDLRAGDLAQTEDHALIALSAYYPLADVPEAWQSGMRLRRQAEQPDFAGTSAQCARRDMSCGEVSKKALFMHPPYQGGVGYTFAEFAPVTLPATPPAAFRAVVGKGDGSYLGDGILYKLAVVDANGKETVAAEKTVTQHEWVPIEADLGKWAGQAVRLKLVADVGVADNSEGDWAGWADLRIESLKPEIRWQLPPDDSAFRSEPGPWRIANVTAADLRAAKAGRLHYDGMGLSGTGGEYESYAILNGVKLGPMAPAGGGETENRWALDVTVPLTPEALKTLGLRNRFQLDNPGKDWFKVRRFWLEVELADGRKCSSDISTAAFTQPPGWPYGEGILVPHGERITVDLWFRP